MQTDTERSLHNTENTKTFSQQFSKPKLIFFLNQKIFLTVKDFVIYIYKSKEHFSKHPTQPQKYFNMNTLEAQIKENSCFKIKDYQFEECLIHEDSEKINELMDVIENNRRLIAMEKMFPRRFEDLDEKIIEKKQEKINI